MKTHCMSYTRPYKIWRNMLKRCLEKSHRSWINYGGRGITVCEEWQKSFETFWKDMHENYSDNLTLSRIDNDGSYNKNNCMWATMKQQQRNKRSNIKVHTPYGVMVVSELAELLQLNQVTLGRRLKKYKQTSHIIVLDINAWLDVSRGIRLNKGADHPHSIIE